MANLEGEQPYLGDEDDHHGYYNHVRIILGMILQIKNLAIQTTNIFLKTPWSVRWPLTTIGTPKPSFLGGL